ncbi:MAG: hypothetical protein AAGI14_02890 [Pseudomonadota bacterium]
MVTFDSVPANPTFIGLDYANIVQKPARGVTVQALDSSGTVLDTDVTDDAGAYDVTVAAGTDVRIRVRSEAINTGTASWDIRVLNNTSSNAIYTLNGSLSSSGTADSTRNLNAASGWGGTSYTGTRAAAPFAILDAMYEAVQTVVAVDADVTFPALEVLWSVNNRPTSGARDIATGDVGTSFYTRLSGQPTIVILGAENNDTDEYDSHVIVHEFGHYFEDQISRSDSVGGSWSTNLRLDPRLAFGEGFGNAFSGMILEDPIYRDSLGTGQSSGFNIDVETGNRPNDGWFNAESVQNILYDLYDSDDDGNDTISAGFGPIYETLTEQTYREADEFTSIFLFSDAVRGKTGIDDTVLTTLLTDQSINGTGPRGVGETNDGARAEVLPVYKTLTVGGSAVTVCSSAVNGTTNRLGVRDFATLTLTATTSLTITATKTSGAAATTDPDFFIWEEGVLFTSRVADSGVADSETWTGTLDAGTYAIEFFDTNNFSSASEADSCFDLSAS